MVKALRNDAAGRYLVTTATGSQYLLDLTERTVQRVMAGTALLIEYLDVGFSQLRRDGDTLELLMHEFCSIGSPERYWLQIRDDHIVTFRTTSPCGGHRCPEPIGSLTCVATLIRKLDAPTIF